VTAIPKFLESQFLAGPDGQPPVLTAAVFPYVADLPQQAPNALINTYRELYWRIVDEIEKELPGEAKRRAGSRLQLISWRTPMTSSPGVFMGTTSMDFVR